MARLAIISVAGWGGTGACAARRRGAGRCASDCPGREQAARAAQDCWQPLACALLQYHTGIYTRIGRIAEYSALGSTQTVGRRNAWPGS